VSNLAEPCDTSPRSFPLTCGHCKAEFPGSYKQAWRQRRHGTAAYCSRICLDAAASARFSRPIPMRGPCPTCGKPFQSRTAKIFCSQACYMGSEQFKAHIRAAQTKTLQPEIRAKLHASRSANHTEEFQCKECGKPGRRKLSEGKRNKRRQFCCKPCYREYMAKRFDRWVANPETLALPQNYDEFLTQAELPCLVEGCGWHGRWLTLHMNQAHGVPAEEFKRAAGFNLSTGVITTEMARSLQARPSNGRPELLDAARIASAVAVRENPVRYRSLEAVEHARKARALLCEEVGPERECRGCGVSFRQRHVFGRAVYCTVDCRQQHYNRKARPCPKVRARGPDGKIRWVEAA